VIRRSRTSDHEAAETAIRGQGQRIATEGGAGGCAARRVVAWRFLKTSTALLASNAVSRRMLVEGRDVWGDVTMTAEQQALDSFYALDNVSRSRCRGRSGAPWDWRSLNADDANSTGPEAAGSAGAGRPRSRYPEQGSPRRPRSQRWVSRRSHSVALLTATSRACVRISRCRRRIVVSTPGLVNHIRAQRSVDAGDRYTERGSSAHNHRLAQRIPRCCT
jgi:hypothetical protein